VWYGIRTTMCSLCIQESSSGDEEDILANKEKKIYLGLEFGVKVGF